MKVEIYSKPQCPFCVQAKALAERKGYELTYKMLDEDFTREDLMETFPTARTFPQIVVDGNKIGGFTEFKALVDKLD
jgi:glutaredoxin 3|tara:strand:+ start:4223 stop:4453 length:231 start_codon:yes stop_codon:yes gene_type:complete